MNTELTIRKKILSPPGDTIQETIDTIGMTQAELAERMGRPKEKVNYIIKGREPISINTAIQLERVLGIPISFWMERERIYREALARIQQESTLEKMVDWMRSFPIRELKKWGWLPKVRDQVRLSEALLGFFGVASQKEWERIYIDDKISVAFRLSLAYTKSPQAMSAWLRIGELEVSGLQLSDFDRKKFLITLDSIKALVMNQPEDFNTQLKLRCGECGVAVIYTQCLPKAPINGATRWVYGHPIIQLSDRYKRNDQFWFSFYHEAGHILLHGKKDVFLDDGHTSDPVKEQEANTFALKYLFPKNLEDEIKSYKQLSGEILIELAAKYRTHPGIIVAQLQRRKMINYYDGVDFFEKVSLFD